MLYNFDINNRAFSAIKDKRKKVEIRVTKVNENFDYGLVKVNDYINFTSYSGQHLLCKVKLVNWYSTIEELLNVEGTQYTLSSTNDFNEGVKSINSFDGYTEGIKVNGVYAIHIEPIKISLSELKVVSDNISIDEYIHYREIVKQSMEYPEWLGDFTKEELMILLDNGSKIWLYYLDESFVCSMMTLPNDEKSIEKMQLIGYKPNDVIDYGPMMVNPVFIGNGLQYQMLQELDKYSLSNNYKYAASTIHPDNIYSINNLIKSGFELTSQKSFKRGLRNIYLKTL